MSVLLLNAVYNEQQERKKRMRSFSSMTVDTFSGGSAGVNTKTRHRKWKPAAQQKYTLFKSGLRVSLRDINAVFENGLLTHDYLWYFVHTDPKIERADRIEPKWIVVLCASGKEENVYYHPQQPYLTTIYKDIGRTDTKLALTMMADGTPYWVDTHIARIQRDKEAKRRYSVKQRTKE